MFDTIAPHYDFLNRLLSLRRDILWRRDLVTALRLEPGQRVLDVACGTGDVGLEIARRTSNRVTVCGVDFAVEMLRLAMPKIKRQAAQNAMMVAAADAFALPVAPDSLDAVTIAFGIRNIQDKIGAMKEFHKTLKPGGRLAVLELATPESGLLRLAYLAYFNRFLPFVGRFFSRHRFAYTYLPDSVSQFPAAAGFARLMTAAGYTDVRYRKLTLGVAVLFVGAKG